MFPFADCKTFWLYRGASRLALSMAAAAIPVLVPAYAQTIPFATPHTSAKDVSAMQKVQGLLQRARAARSAGRLVQPAGDNVAEFDAEVLKLDPDNSS